MTVYVNQNFENTGLDNGETAFWVLGHTGDQAGAIYDPDYAVNPLRGSQSLRMKAGGAGNEGSYAIAGFSLGAPITDLYFHFILKPLVFPTVDFLYYGYGAELWQCYYVNSDMSIMRHHENLWISQTGLLSVIFNSTNRLQGTTALQIGQTYHIWMRIQRTNQFPGVCQGWVKLSTTSTMPETNEIEWNESTYYIYDGIADGICAAGFTNLRESDTDTVFDQFIVASTIEEINALLDVSPSDLSINIYQGINTSEVFSVSIEVLVSDLSINTYQGISINENINFEIQLVVNIYQGINTSESIDRNLPLSGINIWQGINLSEDISFVLPLGGIDISQGINTSENISTDLPLGDISVYDSMSINEVFENIIPMAVNIYENLSTVESLLESVPLGLLDQYESLTISELRELIIEGIIPDINGNASELISVLENIALNIFLDSINFQPVNLQEFLSILVDISPSIFENMTIGEFFQIITSNPELNFDQGMTIEEYINLIVSSPDIYNIQGSDIINLSEYILGQMSISGIEVNSIFSIAESILIKMSDFEVLANEGISLNEQVQAYLPLDQNIYQTINILEYLNLAFDFVDIASFSNISLSEYIAVVMYKMGISGKVNVFVSGKKSGITAFGKKPKVNLR